VLLSRFQDVAQRVVDKFVSDASELDLAMERLIRDAEEGSIGHPEALKNALASITAIRRRRSRRFVSAVINSQASEQMNRTSSIALDMESAVPKCA